MSWMNFTEYVLLEHAVSDRLEALRGAAHSDWPRGGVRCCRHALLRVLGVVGILTAAATTVLVSLPTGRAAGESLDPVVRGGDRVLTVGATSWPQRGHSVVGGFIVTETARSATLGRRLAEGLDGGAR